MTACFVLRISDFGRYRLKLAPCPLDTLSDVKGESIVEDQSSANPMPQRLETHFSHRSPALHRAFFAACVKSGKLGSESGSARTVFQNSSIPQPGFRKPTPSPSSSSTTTSEVYPLFLRELRVLLSFLLFFYPFPQYPSQRTGGCLENVYGQRPTHSSIDGWPARNGPQYPDKHPCFPRARQDKGEYNQEEGKIATFV
jgi:hypothetical protein